MPGRGSLAAAVTGSVAATALLVAPAHASGAVLTFNPDFLTEMSANSVQLSAIAPATLEASTMSMGARAKGYKAKLRGGLQFDSGAGRVALDHITVDSRSGKAKAKVGTSLNSESVDATGILVFSGGKNTFSSNGKWKNAKVSLSKSAMIRGQSAEPASVLCSILQVPIGTVSKGQRLGKITIKAKR